MQRVAAAAAAAAHRLRWRLEKGCRPTGSGLRAPWSVDCYNILLASVLSLLVSGLYLSCTVSEILPIHCKMNMVSSHNLKVVRAFPRMQANLPEISIMLMGRTPWHIPERWLIISSKAILVCHYREIVVMTETETVIVLENTQRKFQKVNSIHSQTHNSEEM